MGVGGWESRLKKEERNGSEVPWEAFNLGFGFAKIQCTNKEKKADEDGRDAEVRTKGLHAASVLPAAPPPSQVFPLPEERWGVWLPWSREAIMGIR